MLGPHERITPCLNTSVFDLVSPADGGPDYDPGYNTETLRLARAANGDLRQYLHSHPDIEEHMRAKWGLQVAEGIAFLHEREIVWGDCSPTNVLLNAKLEVWLCDFAGSSLPFSPALTVAPPDRYCFPEMANFSADKRIDIYAFVSRCSLGMKTRSPRGGGCPTCIAVVGRAFLTRSQCSDTHTKVWRSTANAC
ncbi:kinase-like domain-containing protein [Mycena amicta]|nr:kinase-like domain-containing protein [Mycena amicta]